LTIENYGGVDTSIFDEITLVFRARTKHSVSNEYQRITVIIKEIIDYEP
jgi:hypothetical protein